MPARKISTHDLPWQINTCESQHDTLIRASTQSSPGYAVSGAVVVICLRHCMIQRNRAGDLQLGEKWVIPALFFCSVGWWTLVWVLQCQFHYLCCPIGLKSSVNHHHLWCHMPVVKKLLKAHGWFSGGDANPWCNSSWHGNPRLAHQWAWSKMPK